MNREISIVQYLKKMLNKVWIVILLVAIFGGLMYSYSAFITTPMYTSTAKMFVDNKTDQSTSSTISSADMSARASLVKTYAQIIKSRTLMENVCKKIEEYKTRPEYSFLLDAEHTPQELISAVQVAAVENTEVFNIKLSLADPEEAQFIVNAITEFLPDMVNNKVKSSSVTLIDSADLPTSPSSPNIAKNTVIGALIGFVIAAAIIFIIYITDTVVHTEDTLVEAFENVTILGVIPLMHSDVDYVPIAPRKARNN